MSDKKIEYLLEQLKTVHYWDLQNLFSEDEAKLLEIAHDVRTRELSRDILPLIDGKDIKCLDEVYGEYRKKKYNQLLYKSCI
jgi:hypothetical protein